MAGSILTFAFVGPLAWVSQDGGPTPSQDTPKCAECRVVLTPMPTVAGGGVDNSLPGQMRDVIRDAHGRYWFSLYTSPLPAVYDSAGRLLPELGRVGSGPGEYSHESFQVVYRGDSVLVVNVGNKVAYVFGPDLTVARSFPVPYIRVELGVYATLGSGFVVGGNLGGAGRMTTTGYRWHVFDSTWNLLKSFGTDAAGMQQEFGIRSFGPRLAPSGDGNNFWAGNMLRYEIDLWSREGEKLRTIRRDVPWFPPVARSVNPTRAAPPHSRWLGMREVDGKLWVLVNVADENWSEGFGDDVPSPAGGMRPMLANYRRYMDTVIEVFDATTGELLVSDRVDEALFAMLDGGVAMSVSSEEDEEFPVYRLSIAEATDSSSSEFVRTPMSAESRSLIYRVAFLLVVLILGAAYLRARSRRDAR